MSDMNLTPLEPDEAVHAFLDGELDIADEQRLFDELASSADLRTEMKDALSIRAAVHRDVIAPPASAETGLFSSVGFGSAVGASTITGASTVGAGSTSIMLNRLISGIIGLAAGLAIALFLVDYTARTDNTGVAGYTPKQSKQQASQSAPVRVDTVYSTRVVTRVVSARPPVVAEKQLPPTPSPLPTTDEANSVVPTTASELRIAESPISRYVATDGSNQASTLSAALRRPDHVSPSPYSPMVSVRFRTLASGLPTTEPTPKSVQDALIPNTAFSLLYPLDDKQQLGVEMGQESFRQKFKGMEADREISITQTPVLFWIGGTYIVTPIEFSFLSGLSPFAEVTLGMVFKQGPIGRGTLGLSYQPIGPLRMSVGIDGSALLYQFQNTSFTSTKWGVSYGLSVDIGAIR